MAEPRLKSDILSSIYGGKVTPDDLNTFLQKDSNSVMAVMDHNIRQEKFEKSKARMQEQITKTKETLTTTFLSPLAKKETPESIVDVAELATEAIPGGGALKAGAGVLGTLVGVGPLVAARKGDKSIGNLFAYKGPEGALRVEISDKAAKLTRKPEEFLEQRVYRLDEVYEHEDLYSIYPDLRNTSVVFDPNLPEKIKGAVAKDGTIKLNPKTARSNLLTVMHEVQHKIQDIEGWARGSTTNEFVGLGLDAETATAYYRLTYGEAEARAITAKFAALEPQYKELRDMLALRKKHKVGSAGYNRATESVKDIIRRIRTMDQPIKFYIQRDIGTDVPALVKTERTPVTDQDIANYEEQLADWSARQIEKVEQARESGEFIAEPVGD